MHMCGIFGCIGVKEVKSSVFKAFQHHTSHDDGDGIFKIHSALDYTLQGLHLQNYRGEESAGIVTWDKKKQFGQRLIFEGGKRVGTVDHLREKLKKSGPEFPGTAAMGHVRYGTFGGTGLGNAQPITKNISGNWISIAHNGDLLYVHIDGNWYTISQARAILQRQAPFDTKTDTEIILHLLARKTGNTLTERIYKVLQDVRGAYSLLFLTEEGYLIAARDPWGFRPLSLGVDESGACYFSSEDWVLHHLGINSVTKIERGEIIVISPELEVSRYQLPQQQSSFCSFEFVYFSMPASTFLAESGTEMRRTFGAQLAREVLEKNELPKLDLIAPVLDSGLMSACGFQEHLASQGIFIPLIPAIFRNHYSGRSFITPGQKNRENAVDLKFIFDPNIFKGKRIGTVDDSIVRSTTSKKLVGKLFSVGAQAVHIFIPSPRIVGTCPYGIDMKTLEELIAASKTLEETCTVIGANTLHHLSIEGFKSCFRDCNNFCMGCFTRHYPIPLPSEGFMTPQGES